MFSGGIESNTRVKWVKHQKNISDEISETSQRVSSSVLFTSQGVNQP